MAQFLLHKTGPATSLVIFNDSLNKPNPPNFIQFNRPNIHNWVRRKPAQLFDLDFFFFLFLTRRLTDWLTGGADWGDSYEIIAPLKNALHTLGATAPRVCSRCWAGFDPDLWWLSECNSSVKSFGFQTYFWSVYHL